ncbi:hypothetical protein VE02_10050 [Pseudogymnoascus sp. 03VT05]|nr:hypothetical protein VE02_10050 [Pseudogymnoascus sp. 03VT05]
MKAAGVDVISTYVIWIHHEEVENQFDFSGNRNITGFIETATEAGFQVIARLGPWVHAEVRNGGLPDWVVSKSTKMTRPDPDHDPDHTDIAKDAKDAKDAKATVDVV